jgi:hypothetical protein
MMRLLYETEKGDGEQFTVAKLLTVPFSTPGISGTLTEFVRIRSTSPRFSASNERLEFTAEKRGRSQQLGPFDSQERSYDSTCSDHAGDMSRAVTGNGIGSGAAGSGLA